MMILYHWIIGKRKEVKMKFFILYKNHKIPIQRSVERLGVLIWFSLKLD